MIFLQVDDHQEIAEAPYPCEFCVLAATADGLIWLPNSMPLTLSLVMIKANFPQGSTKLQQFRDTASHSHKSRLVRQKAKELGIYLVYLPPYSPNLNPIEFIWKSIKRVLSTSFVPSLAEMRRIITESFCRFAECKSYAGYWIEKFILNNKNYKNLCL